MEQNHYLVVLLLVATSFFISSCGSFQGRYKIESTQVDSVEDIGSVRVSVLSVAPWSDYREALTPNFTISQEQALNLVSADTRYLSQRSLDSFKAAFKLAELPSTQKTVTETTTDGTTVTETTSPGDLSTVPESSVTANEGDKGASPGFGEDVTLANLSRMDARSRYQAATALYQEVQLLNRYIEDVALREGYAPYVLRLQVTSMPNTRFLPYDAYVNLGFFNNKDKRLTGDTSAKLPLVLPLIATDSLESSATSSELGAIRETGLSLSALGSKAFGADIGQIKSDLEAALGRDTNSLFTLGRLADNVIRVRIGAMQQVRTDYAMVPRSETVTVLVMADKTLAESDEALNRLLHIHSYTEYIHVTKGRHESGGGTQRTVTDARDREIALENLRLHGIDGLLNRHQERNSPKLDYVGIPVSVPDYNHLYTAYDKLWDSVITGDWKSYLNILSKWCVEWSTAATDDANWTQEVKAVCSEGHFIEAEQLWSDIAYYQPVYGVDTLRVELPQNSKPILFGEQTAFLIDDEKSDSNITLRGGLRLSNDNICAALVFYTDNPGGTKTLLQSFPPSKVATSNRGQDVTLTFPSMRVLQLADSVKKGQAQVRVALRTKRTKPCLMVLPEDYDCRASNRICSKKVMYLSKVKPSKPKAKFSITPVSGYVVADASGNGSLTIEILLTEDPPAPKTIEVLFSNASYDSSHADSEPLVQKGNGFVINLTSKKTPKTVKVQLSGLAVGEDFIIKAKDDVAQLDDVTMKVRSSGADKKQP